MSQSRREFAAALAAAAVGQHPILGANDRIRAGVIGAGGRARELLEQAVTIPNMEVVALADVYEPNLDRTKAGFTPHAVLYKDYRKLLESRSVDAVIIASPDHWHKQMSVDALNAGLDVYCEKPLTKTIEEGPEIIRAVEKNKRILQVGTQHRSSPHFVKAKEVLDSGVLGKIVFVRSSWCFNSPAVAKVEPVEVSKLDWDAWLGPAPKRPFDAALFRHWRYYWDIGGGHLTDLQTHLIDTVHWFMKADRPISAVAAGGLFVFEDSRECPDTILAQYEYPQKFVYTYEGTFGSRYEGAFLEFRGKNATLYLDRGQFDVIPESSSDAGLERHYVQDNIGKGDGRARGHDTKLHLENFFDCVRSRKQPACDVYAGHRSALCGHLGNLSYRQGRKLRWDPEKEKII